MKSTTKLLPLIFAAMFIVFGTGSALAGEYSSKETNPKFLAEGIKHAEEGIAAANAGDAAGALAHLTAALDSLKEINSEANAPKLQKAGGKLRVAWAHAKQAVKFAKKGDDAKASSHMGKIAGSAQKGLDKLKTLNFNH
ncbi:MAG TPA: hypothetical protein ENJ32_00865 [Crenotrichaceae bacterium]|nr:hypothetical protein [Crenotrichaceae bacterium]